MKNQFRKIGLILIATILLSSACSNDSGYSRQGSSDNSQPADEQNQSSSNTETARPIRPHLSYPLILKANNILKFEQLEGDPRWVENQKERFLSGVWQFNSNQTFSFS